MIESDILHRVARAIEAGHEIGAVDALVEHFDGLFTAGRFDDASALLRQLDPATLPPKVITGVLTITSHAAEHIAEARQVFYGRAAPVMRSAPNVNRDAVENALRRLR
jgi:hypothetical protein